MSNWYYNNPVNINFGQGSIKSLPDVVGSDNSVLITTPGFTKRGVTGMLKNMLGNSLVKIFDSVNPNPTFISIKTAFNEFKQYEYDTIIALGGGSVIDTAKAVSAIGTSNDKNWLDEHLKKDGSFPENFIPKPIIAIPTTAGTGSEVTMWATVWDKEEKKKYSISHPYLYPETAILDPELTLTLSEKESVYTGLDALSHAMESIWSKNNNPVSDIFALKAISLIYDYLPLLKVNLTDNILREHMLRASFFAGLAFSNTKTGLAHSISYPLTAHFGLPHGLACSLPLSHILKINGNKSFERIKIIAKALRADVTVESMLLQINKLFNKLGVSQNLSDYKIDRNQAELILSLAYTPGRFDNNVVLFNDDDIRDIIYSLF